MRNRIGRFFSAPVFQDEEKTRVAGMLRVITLAVFAIATVLTLSVGLLTGVVFSSGLMPGYGTGLLALISDFAVRRGHLTLASWLIVGALWFNVTLVTFLGGTIRNPVVGVYVLGIIIAGLLISRRAALVFTGLCALTLAALLDLEQSGLIQGSDTPANTSQWFVYIATFVTVVVLLGLARRSIDESIARARRNESALTDSYRELQATRDRLEQRVAERTAELEVSAEVGRVVTSILDQDDLIRQVVHLITGRFNLYYAAVFLVDEDGKFAVLREATGVAGAVLKESGHQLEIGGQSMVSATIVTKKSRVSGQAQDEAARYANPLLPETRSEIALPLVVGDRVFGALDVQSTRPDAFDEARVALLQNLANQIAIALNNARQFEDAQREARQSIALFEASRLAGSISDDLSTAAGQLLGTVAQQADFDAWAAYTLDAERNTFTMLSAQALAGSAPADTAARLVAGDWQPHPAVALAIRLRQPVVINDPEFDPLLGSLPLQVRRDLGKSVSAPALIGDRVVGAITLARAIHRGSLSRRDVQLAQAIANQLAVTIQNRQLLEQAQSAANELSLLMRRYTHEGWSQLPKEPEQEAALVAEYSQPGAGPLDPAVLPRVEQAARANTLEPIPYDGQAALGIPITLRGEVIGTLGVQKDADHRWTEDERVTLRAVADQVAQSLEAARLLDETETSLRETTELYHAGQAITAADSLDEILAAFTGHVISPRIDRCVLAMLDVPGGAGGGPVRDAAVEIVAAWERGRERSPALHNHPLRGRRSDSPWLGAEPSIVPDVMASAVLSEEARRALQAQNVRAQAAIPMLIGGRPIGWLMFESLGGPYAFSEREIRVYRTLAGQAAVAIENRRLFEETQANLRETTDLYRAGQAMTAAQTPADILSAFTGHVVAPPIDRCYLALIDPNSPPEDVVVETVAGWARESETPAGAGVRWRLADTPHVGAEPSVIPDVGASVGAIVGAIHESPQHDPGVKAQAIIPLLVAGRPIGWLLFESLRGPYAFSEREIRVYRTLAGQAAVALESQRLFGETQRRAEIESALNQISQTIRASLDPQAVLDLQATIAEMGRVLRASRSFYMSNDDDHSYTYAYEWCLPGVTSFKGVSGAWADWPQAYKKFRAGQGIVTEAVERDDSLELSQRTAMMRRGALSHMHVPVLTGNRLAGILGFEQVDRERRWSSDEVSMVQRVADQLAAALENARLYQNVRSRVNELTALTRIGRRLAATLQLEEVLNTIVEEALNVTPADRGSIALYNVEYDALEMRVLLGYSEAALQAMTEGGRRLLRRGEGLHGRMLATGQAVLSNDAGYGADAGVENATRSELIVPIKQGEALLGALNLESARSYAFNEGDQRLMEALADQAAVAIANARSYEAERAALERMREVDRLKTQFLANMSHELRTPLNSIIGFSRVILRGIDGPLTDMQQADLSAIHNSGQHLLGLINDILDLSKIEAGKMELSLEEIDLHEIIKGVMSTAIALVKDKKVELRQDVPDDLPRIRADARRIRQVILNLVANAAKFTERGHITARAVAHPHEIVVTVFDTGIGIPPDKLDHIFEEFTQVDASTTRKVGGTGLGLAISRRFVEMHGGRIWVESEVGVGSMFNFTLPVEQSPQPGEQAEDNGYELAEKLVLSIDDDPGVVTLYRRYLEKQGYKVVGLEDPVRALDEARRLQPFAITLDVLMPNRDGWTVLAELKSTPETSRIPIIVCTIVEDESKGFSLGAADYLVKPITESELLRALGRVATGRSIQTVLIIDDEIDALRLLRRMLESRPGFRVIEAQGGLQGIASVEKHRPDLIILDLMMPDVDGFAVLDKVKSDAPSRNTPVIIVTAKDLTADDRARLHGKAAALLNKGVFSPEYLLHEISTALDQLNRRLPAPAGQTPERVSGRGPGGS